MGDIETAWFLSACCELFRMMLCFAISIVCNLYFSMYAPSEYVFSCCRILYSIDYLLSDMNGIEYFRRFLSLQTQGIELLLFWIEVEIFKECDDKKQKYSLALSIFDKFIQSNANYKIGQNVL